MTIQEHCNGDFGPTLLVEHGTSHIFDDSAEKQTGPFDLSQAGFLSTANTNSAGGIYRVDLSDGLPGNHP